MPRPCHLAHPVPQPAACRLCLLYVERADYRRRWDSPRYHTTLPGIPRSPECRHLGGSAGRGCCPNCKPGEGEGKFPLLACAIHGTCTRFWPGVGKGCCLDCPNYTPVEEG